MAHEVVLGSYDALLARGEQGFEVVGPRGPMAVLAVAHGGAVHAYRNRCPHRGVPLDWMPDQFLNADGTLIQCATHGALFRIHDGLCVAGPCIGRSLQPLPVRLRDGMLVLQTAAAADTGDG
jgi:nitrite reductase/ring-hydroxylating ferredoxin subunit